MSVTPQPLLPQTPPRIASVDAYRGLVMFLMMAEVLELRHVAREVPTDYWKFLAEQQSHVEWAGCTLHDLIQPSFSFLVGVAVPFSLANRIARGQSRWRIFGHAVLRAVILVLLGVFLRSMHKGQTNWTFEDTLSQIGLGYVLLVLLGFTKQRWQWLALIILLVGYWGFFVAYPLPTPDFDYQSVGVSADWHAQYNFGGFAAHWNKNSNPAWAFDQWFLNLFPREKPFEFNGGGYSTLSFVPTLATMVLGLIAGGWIRRDGSPWYKAGWLTLAGGVLLAAGLIAHETGLCPAVKRIWTPSWTLYSGGWCFFILAAFYAIMDAGKLQTWAFPLQVIGANSITAYILAHGPDRFVANSIRLHFGEDVFQAFGQHYEPLFAGIVTLIVLWLILYWLYRQKIYLRI